MKVIKGINIFCVMSIFTLGGCATSMEELITISDVRMIKMSELKEYIGDESNDAIYTSWGCNDCFIVTLFSDLDYLAYANEHDVVIGVRGTLCDEPDVPVLLNSPSLYSNGKNVNRLRNVARLPLPTNENGLYEYCFVVLAYWTMQREIPRSFKNSDSPKYYKSFNLINNPVDLCFRITGIDMLKMGYKSDTIRVTSEQLVEAKNKCIRPAYVPLSK